jgi:hypothetical protein
VSPDVDSPLRVNRLAGLALSAALLALLGTSCGESSRVDPNAKVTITGSVQTPAGAPLAGRGVRLGSGVPDDDATLAVLTAGLACTGGLCSGTVLDTKTSATGTYAFALKGRDTQGSFGKVRSELVSVSAAPTGDQVSGASASARFVVQTEKVQLPALRLVDPGLSVRAEGASVVSRWSTPRPGPYVLSFETGSPVPAWQVTTTQARSALDGRLLEGASGRAVLSGGSEDSIEGSEVSLRWRSPGAAFASETGAPVSRGSTCSYSRPGRGGPSGPCGLTDGDLSSAVARPLLCDPGTPSQTSPPACPAATTVTLTLRRPVPADLLVVRGCSGSCPVQTSTDGRAFTTVGAAASDDAALRVDGPPIRAVRVDLGAAGLREVSVWEPQATPTLRRVTPRALEDLRAPYVASIPRAQLRVYLAAGALVLFLMLALAFRLGRRRPRVHALRG